MNEDAVLAIEQVGSVKIMRALMVPPDKPKKIYPLNQ
jgi:hypothetical protein